MWSVLWYELPVHTADLGTTFCNLIPLPTAAAWKHILSWPNEDALSAQD